MARARALIPHRTRLPPGERVTVRTGDRGHATMHAWASTRFAPAAMRRARPDAFTSETLGRRCCRGSRCAARRGATSCGSRISIRGGRVASTRTFSSPIFAGWAWTGTRVPTSADRTRRTASPSVGTPTPPRWRSCRRLRARARAASFARRRWRPTGPSRSIRAPAGRDPHDPIGRRRCGGPYRPARSPCTTRCSAPRPRMSRRRSATSCCGVRTGRGGTSSRSSSTTRRWASPRSCAARTSCTARRVRRGCRARCSCRRRRCGPPLSERLRIDPHLGHLLLHHAAIFR